MQSEIISGYALRAGAEEHVFFRVFEHGFIKIVYVTITAVQRHNTLRPAAYGI